MSADKTEDIPERMQYKLCADAVKNWMKKKDILISQIDEMMLYMKEQEECPHGMKFNEYCDYCDGS